MVQDFSLRNGILGYSFWPGYYIGKYWSTMIYEKYKDQGTAK